MKCNFFRSESAYFVENSITIFDYLVALKWAGFILADVQSDVISPSRMHETAFAIDQQLRQWHFVKYFPMYNEALLEV